MGYYSSMGFEIFIPVDTSRVDFIAHKDGELIKVQVKTLAKRRYKGTEYDVAILSSRRSGGQGSYELSELDECFVVGAGVGWRIPYNIVHPSMSVMLGSNKETYSPKHNYPVSEWEVSIH